MLHRIFQSLISLLTSVVLVAAVCAATAQPVVSTPPASQAVRWLSSAALSVTATADGPLVYQWYRGPSGDTSSPVPGATGALLITPALTTTTASYWVRVTAGGAFADSTSASITPIPLTQSLGQETLGLKTMGNSASGKRGDGAIATAASVSAGSEHSLFIKADGTLWAMGSNAAGQLGLGTSGINSRATPTQVATGVATASAGGSHSLFVKIDGTLWAMGSNSFGQLGDGTTTNRSAPVQVATGVVSVAAGGVHSLFVKTDGTLWAMGFNRAGELGDGSTTHRSIPVLIATDVVAISAGNSLSLFVKADSTLWAMGGNSSGQLGLGSSDNTAHSTPAQVASGVASASAGSSHSLFIKTDGTLWGMGDNSHRKLGNALTFGSHTPAQIGSGVVSASAGTRHSMFIKTDGTLWGMGFNDDARIGLRSGTTAGGQVLSASGAASVSAGDSHTLVAGGSHAVIFDLGTYGVRTGGGALKQRFWTSTDAVAPTVTGSGGQAFTGWDVAFGSITGSLTVTAQFAVATPPEISTPPASRVVPWQGSTALSVVATANGVLTYQWYRGASGDTSSPVANVTGPLFVTPALDTATSFWVRVMNSELSINSPTAVLTVNTPAQPVGLGTSGSNIHGQLGDGSTTGRANPDQVATDVISISGGGNHSLFVKSDQTLWAAGYNNYGQLGDGSTVNRSTPVPVATGVVSVSAGGSHSTFVKTDGTLWTVGDNRYGQLGNDRSTNPSTPLQVTSDVASVSAGQIHTLFVKTDGTLWGMGAQVGDGSNVRSSPVQIASGVVSVSAGNQHSLFVKNDGTLWAFGFNTYGELGVGSNISQRTPVQVATGVAFGCVGGSHTLFGKIDGTLWAMGRNDSGQLGDGSTTHRSTPVQVASGVSAVSAGLFHSLFIKTDGTLWGMGANTSGQLGDGTMTNRLFPVQVANGATAVALVDAGSVSTLFVSPSRTVTFDLGLYGIRSGGGALAQTVWYGAAAFAPSLTAASGWTFNGWDVDFASVTTDLAVTARYQSPYAAWAAGRSLAGTDAEATADPDGDGLPNLLEYALGLDPIQNTGEVGKPVVSRSGDALTLTYIRRIEAPDLTYLVEVSSDLVIWDSGTDAIEQVSVTTLDATRQEIVVRDRTSLSSSPKRFIRLRVVR